ncbi:hypothetical protein C8J56DRAFT_1043162 [Mycena floridula]|nr:hypothetical protein C8J56DRAFT_1043162 [Mycena floridula]
MESRGLAGHGKRREQPAHGAGVLTTKRYDANDVGHRSGNRPPSRKIGGLIRKIGNPPKKSSKIDERGVRKQLIERLKEDKLENIAIQCSEDQTIADLIEYRQNPLRRVAKTEVIIQLLSLSKRKRSPSPEPEEEGLTKRFKSFANYYQRCDSPSISAESTSYAATQGAKYAIRDGRYNPASPIPTVAPVIDIYHPVFAQFRAKLRSPISPTLPFELRAKTAEMMRFCSGIQIMENPRTEPTRSVLSRILESPLLKSVNVDMSAADHVVLSLKTKVNQMAALVIVEEKGELGSGGSEPSVQGTFSWLKFWVAELVQKLFHGCCCPTFIVGIAGPWLVILGAAFPGFPIVQRLTDYIWLGISAVGDEAQVDRVAHILHALKGSVDDLRLYYEALEPKPLTANTPHPRFFPSITSYSRDGIIVNFSYIAPLEPESACIIFLAQEDEGRQVVVKFVHRYGLQVHQLLAQVGLAPQLFYFGPIEGAVDYGTLKMVVMEYLEGTTLVSKYPAGLLPGKLKAEVKKGLDAIHSNGFVYGDLRHPNIMVEKQGNGDTKIKFIDFDWAGEEGQVRYPPHLAPVVVAASGASDYDLITQKHDLAMFNVL